MASNNGNLTEVRIPMPEIGQSDFIREEINKFKLLLFPRREGRIIGSSRTGKPLIQRVPLALSAHKLEFQKHFEPRVVAFGPLHHGDPKFEQAEQTKREFAARFVWDNDTTVEILFQKIMTEISYLRWCYNRMDIEDYDDEKLAWMFFVDGSALLFAVYYTFGGMYWFETELDLLVYFLYDVMLLENQLPYRVLKILIDSTKNPGEWKKSIADFIDDVASRIFEQKSRCWGEEDEPDYVHLLERLRRQLLTGQAEQNRCSVIGKMLLWCGHHAKDYKTVSSIMDLKDSGIRVRPSKTSNLKGISFHCNFPGTLTMPPLVLDDSTPSIFMNLVALESCPDFNNDYSVRTYLWFLRSFIQTAEDVKELRVRGVLHNFHGADEEVPDLFRKMSRDLVPDQELCVDVTENIHKYCNSWLIRTYSNYFGANWSVLAFLSVIVGLLLTLLQTYFTVYPKK